MLRHARGTAAVTELFRGFDRTYFTVLATSTHGERMRYEESPGMATDLQRGRDAVVERWLQWRLQGDATPQQTPSESAETRHPSHWLVAAEPTLGSGRTRSFPVQKVLKNELIHIKWTYQVAMQSTLVLAGLDLPSGYQTPLDVRVDYEDLAAQTQLAAGMAAQILTQAKPLTEIGSAMGHPRRWYSDLHGQVLAVGGSMSILPDRPVANSLVVLKTTWAGAS